MSIRWRRVSLDRGTGISVQFDATRIFAEHNPPITLTIDVAPYVPVSITNVANVSGGGDSNLANNASSEAVVIADPIVIQPGVEPQKVQRAKERECSALRAD